MQATQYLFVSKTEMSAYLYQTWQKRVQELLLERQQFSTSCKIVVYPKFSLSGKFQSVGRLC